MIKKNNILGVGITDATKKEILEYIIKSLAIFKKKYYIVTPNPEFLVRAQQNSTFKDILNKANLALADGIGVIIAAQLLGKPLKERFTGVELLESLCEMVAEKPITVGFLGGGPRVAEMTADCLREKHPKLKIVFTGEEWGWSSIRPPRGESGRLPHVADDAPFSGRGPVASFPPASAPKVRAVGIPSSGATPSILNTKYILHNTVDILFVAFGAPKQEFWISENLDKIPVKIAIGVGGAFDYISGKIPRAPAFIRSIGLEWLFRLILQPWRLKRQLSLIKFAYLVLKEAINSKGNL